MWLKERRFNLSPKRGRPPKEKPRQKKVTLRMTDEEYQKTLEAQEKDGQSQMSVSTWVAWKWSEMIARMTKK